MKRTTAFTLTALLLLGAYAVSVQAQEEIPGPPHQFGYGPPPAEPGGGQPPGFYEGPRDFPGRPGVRRPPLAERAGLREEIERVLNLTSQQLQEMRKLRADFQERTRKARTALYALNDEKTAMLSSGKIDMEKLAKIDEEILKAQTDVLRERLKMQRERLKLLSEEQLERLGDFLGRRRDRVGSAETPYHGSRRMPRGRS